MPSRRPPTRVSFLSAWLESWFTADTLPGSSYGSSGASAALSKNPSTAGIPVSSLIWQIFPRSLRFGMPILVAGPLVALFAAASTAQDAVAGACYSIISVLILSDSPQESRR
jgi:hypothetical protein